jgi:hypothetical protein
MLSGMPKPFTCRSVGTKTREVWVVPMYVGEVPRYIGAGEAFHVPRLRDRRQVVTALSILRNPPCSAMV